MGIIPVKVLGSILSGILCEIIGKFITKKFLTQLIETLILNGAKYLKKKDLLKNSNLDDEIADLIINNLENK